MMRTCTLLFLAATMPSVVHVRGAQTECSAHTDCGSEAYCYDAGYFMTGEWNGVGHCDDHLPNCCGGAFGDPIDRDIGNCPAASQCESETATASNCEDICEDHGYDEAQCVAVSSSCAWNNGACSSGVGSASCSYFPAQSTGSTCSEHADCGSLAYCYDTGYYMTGTWSGVGSCSGFPTHCCGGAEGNPIDRDIGNCPASSQCESETATASNCEDICEGHGYDEAQCVAVSSSCAWNNGACGSGVGSASCSYFPAQSNFLGFGCSEHADCGSEAYCYDSGYIMTGEWNGVGYCDYHLPNCCGGADGDPIDRDIGNCPAASQCESETATASNCEDICEDHGYDAAQCAAVSSSCAWNNGACSSGVGSASCSYFPGQTNPLASGCSEHADCGSDEYCYDVGYNMTGTWSGVGLCSGFPTHCCGDAHGDPIDRDVANCPAASQCGSETATASNCEHVCEGHGYDEAQCTAVSQSCAWDDGACWSGVGPTSCSYYTASVGAADGTCSAHTDCSSDEYCYDSGYFMTGEWNGVGYCSGSPDLCCADADGDPIDRDVANCPASSQCATISRASNCEDICEGHGYDAAQCAAVSSSCAWNNGACWSGVGSASCSYFPGQTNPVASGCSEHADCGSDEYCYDTGYYMTGTWSGVGSCSGFPTHCCGGAEGNPIDRDIGNCPAASQCESETATASNCEDICRGPRP